MVRVEVLALKTPLIHPTLPYRFKLLLRPAGQDVKGDTPEVTLPFRGTAITVLADLFKYLFHAARDYIKSAHADGVALWNETSSKITFVLR